MSFQQVAIASANRYYKYLEKSDKGMVIYHALRILEDKSTESHMFYIYLRESANYADTMLEYMRLRIGLIEYDFGQAKPVEYNKYTKSFKFQLKESVAESLNKADISSVSIVSDLKFLVAAVREWYEEHGACVKLPTMVPEIPLFQADGFRDTPSDNQYAAINSILSNPFTYVWGAPGTGKTRLVLARAVTSYVKAQQKVLIVAPTNNAIEQTLRGLIPVLEEAGFDPEEEVFRLGVASADFVTQYGGVCENRASSRAIASIDKQVLQEKEDLKSKQELLSLYGQYLAFQKNYNEYLRWKEPVASHKAALLKEAELVRETFGVYRELENRCAEIQRRLHTYETEVGNVHAEVIPIRQRIDAVEHSIFRAFKKTELKELQEKLNLLLSQEESLQNLINTTNKLAVGLSDEKLAARQEYLKHISEFDKTKAILMENMPSCVNMQNRDQAFTPDTAVAFFNLLEIKMGRAEKDFEEQKQQFEKLDGFSTNTLYLKIKEIELRIQSLLEQRTQINEKSEERMARAKVIAATVDGYIRSISPGDSKFAHVFLDEACYCSMIKAGTLLAMHCPVTFLGDHMQLPPVCEMDDDEISKERGNNCVFLWAQSALYLEDALTRPMAEVFQGYEEHESPSFQQLKKSDLLNTFRFGKSLASVLAEDVYARGFTGSDQHDTEIYYIQAPKMPENEKRTSETECRAILQYVLTHPGEDMGIITPYKNQVKMLKEECASMGERIFTVHGSQGREWDTVLFSAVDTVKMWFTDSGKVKSSGKKVINTAVSRAKKKLIIVCDYDFWITQHDQLIGKLLRVAKEIDG